MLYKTTKKIVAALSGFFLLAVPLAPLSLIPLPVSADQATVYIYDNYYSPQNITIADGSTVTWINYGSMNHTVTANGGAFNSGTLAPGSSFSVTFNGTATYSYYCQFHSGVTGSITVTSGGGGGGSGSGTGTITGTVNQPSSTITINSVASVKSSAMSDNTFQNGWEWVFDVTVPENEPNLAMKFDNWLRANGSGTIPVSNNMRFFSSQSSTAYSEGTAIYVIGAGTYSQNMYLTGDLGNSPAGTRRINIRVQAKIPVGTPNGSYSTTFGIRTQ